MLNDDDSSRTGSRARQVATLYLMIPFFRHTTARIRRLAAGIPRLAALLWAACAVGAAGQVPSDLSMPEVRGSLLFQADSLYKAGLHLEALAHLEDLLERSPNNYLGQVRAARETLVLGYAAPDRDSAKAWYRRAIGHSQRAMALNPAGTDGRYVHIAAVGSLALIESVREKARLGVVVESEARSLLEADPLHAGAHNALGKLYFELASLSWFSRIFARSWMGGDLVSRATWEAAETHLRRAVELQPEQNFHSVDLGALLLKRDRLAEAREVLDAALQVPLEIPEQARFRDDARRLLEEIRRRSRLPE